MNTSPRPARNPRVVPVVIFLAGLGIAGYYGLAWYQLPRWSDQEIEQSVELNLAMDIARMGPQLKPNGEKLDRLRALVRQEVREDIQRELKTVQLRFSAGLVATVIGLGQLVFVVLARRLRPHPPQP
jgi:hypothetical protein